MKTKKRAKGRPQFPERESVKSVMIGFRVDPIKYSFIEKAAELYEMRISEYCEHCLDLETERIITGMV
jgi:hypothetical protein